MAPKWPGHDLRYFGARAAGLEKRRTILVVYETRRKVHVIAIKAPLQEIVAEKPYEDVSVGLLIMVN